MDLHSLPTITLKCLFFITPKIIQDPLEEMDSYRTTQLQKRPGDIPEFLEKIEEAKNKLRQKEHSNTFKTLFGRQ